MHERRVGLFLVAAAAVALSPTGCGSGGTGTGGGTTSTTSATNTTTSSSTTSGTTSSTATSGTTSSSSTSSTTTSTTSTTSTTTAVVGYCAKPCSGAAIECCPPNSPSCPGPDYPNNVTCKNGACFAAECATTAECVAVNPKLDCFVLSGAHSCALACMTDGDCSAPLTCSGMDDSGKKYCLSAGGGCTDDASCSGFGKCVNKVCVCDADSDCTKPGFTKCAK